MRVVKNYLYNVFYQVFILLVPLITIPYISRVLGPTGVGINSYTNSITQYFILFGSIGVNLYGNRQIAYYRDDREKASQAFWEIFIMRAITIALAYVAFFIFLAFTTNYRIDYVMQSILIIAAAFDISWYFMGIENFRVTVMRNVVVKIVSLAFIFTLVKRPTDLATYILILSISQLLGNITLFPYLRNYIKWPDWKKLNIMQHVRPSVILFIPQIATQIYLVLNKTMVGQMVSVTATGYYDNSDKIIKMILAVVTATGTVMLPHVANTFAKGDMDGVKSYLYKSFDFVTASSVPLMFGVAAIAPKFSTWFFSAKFAPVSQLMMIESLVILLIAWSNAIGQQYLLPTNQNKAYTFSVTLGAIVNIIVNIPLILIWKTNGAMLGTVLSEISVTAYQLYVVRDQLDMKQLFNGIWKYILAGVAMFAVVFLMNINLSFNALMLIVEVLIGGIVYIGLIFVLKAPIFELAKTFLAKRRANK